MTIDEHINNFLRDAQYQIALLSIEMNSLEDKGGKRYKDRANWRLQLATFMDIVYEGHWYILGGYNHIQYTDVDATEDKWTEAEVIEEIERLRSLTSMDEAPFITFAAYYPEIFKPTNPIGSNTPGGVSFPPGSNGMTIFYNASGEPYADFISPYSGMTDGESINSYFSGRL